jgi:hypothetical protein
LEGVFLGGWAAATNHCRPWHQNAMLKKSERNREQFNP